MEASLFWKYKTAMLIEKSPTGYHLFTHKKTGDDDYFTYLSRDHFPTKAYRNKNLKPVPAYPIA